MRWREYPVLPEADTLLAELRVGLGDGPARVLAYLARRRASPEVPRDEATRLEVRVGTGLGREATIDALSALERSGLVTTTTVSRDAPGRPPKGWLVDDDGDALVRRTRAHHSRRLLERAGEVAAHFGTSLGAEWAAGLEPAAGPTDRATPFGVALNWVPNGLHGPLLAAADTGAYGEYGLDVRFEPSRGSGEALAGLRSGRADVAVVGAASLCQATEAPLVSLALLYQRSMAVLYTTTGRLGETFTSVEQLRGRRLAVSPDSEVGRLARLFLARAGLLDEVTIVPTSGEERDALIDDEADVATGMPIDPHELSAAGHDVSSLAVVDHFPVPGPALVTTLETATRHPSRLARFLSGTQAGVALARRDPDRVATLVADRTRNDVSSERWRLQQALERSSDTSAVREHGWGWQSVDAWQRLQVALSLEATR